MCWVFLSIMWRLEPLSASCLASIFILQNNVHVAARKQNQLATLWCSVATSFRWRNVHRHQGLTRRASFLHACFSYFFDCLFVIYHLSGDFWENLPPQIVACCWRDLMVALQESSFIKTEKKFFVYTLVRFLLLFCLFLHFFIFSLPAFIVFSLLI